MMADKHDRVFKDLTNKTTRGLKVGFRKLTKKELLKKIDDLKDKQRSYRSFYDKVTSELKNYENKLLRAEIEELKERVNS